jgi:UDP-glucose 4-epimerase
MREILNPGCEVIDLAYATVPKTSYGDPVFDLFANLPGSVGLLEEAMAVGVRRLLLVFSGGTVFGPPCALPMAESHPTAPISPYGITKLTIDHYALMFHHTRGLPVVVVRPANAYGVQQRSRTGQGFLAAAIDAILSRREIEIFGDAGTIRDYIHVTDVASGILAALYFGGDGEIYNLDTGIGASNLDVIALLRPLAEAAGHTIQVRHLPSRRFDVEANVLDAQKLRSACGWRPDVSLERGLAEMWDLALVTSTTT